MKLSTSLLAVAGVYADYACCPYNDYGVVDTGCPFSERTAWGDTDQQVGLTKNECKGWEANVDATKDGSMSPAAYNWGGCGFQRLFDWSGKAKGAAQTGVTYGALNLIAGNGGSALAAANTNFAANGPFGKVALNGMCTLFIPVAHDDIQYVSVAGVHVKGNGFSNVAGCSGGNGLGCSVFDATIVHNSGIRTGTAYTFAVSNDHEGFSNSNNILNANIAGGVGSEDIMLAYTQFGWDGDVDTVQTTNNALWDDGATWPGYGNTGGATTEMNSDYVGANFDVVVHLKSNWCQQHWTRINMQDTHTVGGVTYTEAGFSSTDYTIMATGAGDWPGANSAGFTHAHKDAMDKRFDADVCGFKASHTDLWGGTTAVNAGCTGVKGGNGLESTTGTTKWPNAGSWAGAFSHVYCSGDANTSPHLIYHPSWASGSAVGKTAVLSNFNNDFRRIDGADATQLINIRGNIRQVGTEIQYCSPGHLPEAGLDHCTWNWNFSNAHLDGDAFDKPDFDPGHTVVSWVGVTTAPKSFAVCLAHGNRQQLSAAAANSFPLALNDPGTATCDGLQCEATRPTTDNNCATFTVKCDGGNVGGNTAAEKDAFPNCFQGDEIHFNFQYQGGHATSGNWEDITYVSAWYSTVA